MGVRARERTHLLHLSGVVIDDDARDEWRRVEVALVMQQEDRATVVVHALGQDGKTERFRLAGWAGRAGSGRGGNARTRMMISFRSSVHFLLCKAGATGGGACAARPTDHSLAAVIISIDDEVRVDLGDIDVDEEVLFVSLLLRLCDHLLHDAVVAEVVVVRAHALEVKGLLAVLGAACGGGRRRREDETQRGV